MAFLNSITGWGGRDMAVDLGTANTLVYVRGRGIVLSEPSVVAIDQRSGEVAVISIGGIGGSQRLGDEGDEMDEAIVNHIKREYELVVGQQTEEEIKLENGSAVDMRDELQAEVRSRDMLTGLPK